MQRQEFAEKQAAGTSWFIEEKRSPIAEEAVYRLGRSVVDLYARAMLKMNVQWHVPLSHGPKILAANHPTTTDPFLIMLLSSEQMSVLVTEGCFEIPVFGPLLLESGHVPVVRNSGGSTIREAIRLLRTGRTVAIFPEGALSPLDVGRDLGFHAPHTGVARMALCAGVPVIPVGIHVRREHIQFAETKFKDESVTARWYVGGPYAVTVGEPMNFEGDVEDWAHVRSVSGCIMQRIIHLARESAQRVRSRVVRSPACFDNPRRLTRQRFAPFR